MNLPSFEDVPSNVAPKPPKVYNPVSSLNDLDLGQAMLDTYNSARELLSSTQYAEEIPLNQKAQIVNSLHSVIASLIKQKETLHNIERLKALEDALVKTLKEFPDINARFLDLYSTNLESSSNE